MKKNIWLYLSLLGALLLMPTAEAAAQTVPMANAYTAFGRFGDNQNWLISVNPNTGACAWTAVGGPNGLTANVQINGTSSSDFIFTITSPGTHCSLFGTMNPPTLNNRIVSINAGNLNDVVDGGWMASARLGGDSGDDYVTSGGTNAQLFGWTGNDQLNGSTGAILRGEDGNDRMCALNGTRVNQFIGGLGADTYCGLFSNPVSSASLNCSLCP